MGDHALGCGSHGERIARHNLLRDALYQTAVAASLAPVKEGRFLLPGKDARPADLLIPRWAGGKDACLDVTVVSPLQRAMVAGAAATDGYALTKAFDRKVAKAAEDCRQAGLAFIPLAADTFGGWHAVANEQVTRRRGGASPPPAALPAPDEGELCSPHRESTRASRGQL